MTVVSALVVAAWAVAFSPLFAVRQVDVEGVSGPLLSAVRTTVNEPVGQSLLRVNLHEVTRPVRALPQIRSVQVSRSWPHRLVVQVQARQAVAVLVEGSSSWLVDADAVAFERVDAAPAGLVRLLGGTSRGPAPRAGLLVSTAVRAGLRVSAALPADLAHQVDAVSAPSADAVTLRLSGGRTVLWGDDTQAAAKGQIALALLTGGAKSLDVSAPGAPAVR